jgi:hypothetical protein
MSDLDFEPISTEERDHLADAFDVATARHRVNFRVACAFLTGSKEDLQKLAKFPDEDLESIMDSLWNAETFLREAADYVKAAQARIFCSLEALPERESEQ